MPHGISPAGEDPDPLLDVRNLDIDLAAPGRTVPILAGVFFQIGRGSITGLFGESGCGKTTLAHALLRLLPPRYRVRGSIRLAGRELLPLAERALEALRGAAISLIFQDPLLSLNPVLRVGDQIAEVLRAHGRPRNPADVDALLEMAGLSALRRGSPVARAYPHQLSGGERQRVAIAQALACHPPLIVADEPFSALDTTLVADLTALFRRLRDELGTSFLLISHSPGVLARTADRVLVMERGRIVENGDPRQVFRHPAHPYTASLLRDLPRLPPLADGPSHVA
jgi:ABC-type glutathione transport system ATPase component